MIQSSDSESENRKPGQRLSEGSLALLSFSNALELSSSPLPHVNLPHHRQAQSDALPVGFINLDAVVIKMAELWKMEAVRPERLAVWGAAGR